MVCEVREADMVKWTEKHERALRRARGEECPEPRAEPKPTAPRSTVQFVRECGGCGGTFTHRIGCPRRSK